MPGYFALDTTGSRRSSAPKPEEKRKLRFHGKLDALQDLVLLTEVYGEWDERPNGVWRYRCENGAGLNWSSTRGTLWFDGPLKQRARFEWIIQAALGKRAGSLSRRGGW